MTECELAHEQLEVAVELAQLCVYALDPRTGRLTMTGPFEQIIGEHLEEVTLDELIARIHPDDRALIPLERSTWPEPGERRLRFIRADGTVRWAQSVRRANVDGMIVGAFRDITEEVEREHALVEKERMLSTLLDRINDGIFGLDRELRFTYTNPELLRQAGLPASALTGRFVWDVFRYPEPHPFRDALDAARRTQAVVHEQAYSATVGKWFSVDIYPSPDGYTVFSRDITNAVELEAQKGKLTAQLRALTARLQEIREEESRRIARELHDELGQELTVLKLDIAALQRHSAHAPALVGKLRDLSANVDTTIALVRRIATRLRPRVLDDLGLVAAIEWQAGEIARRTGLQVTLRLPATDVAISEAAAIAIFRTLQELLTNVVRHAAAKRVEVCLAIERARLVLDVADDGCGIAADANGGLGLVGIRERIEAIGGTIDIGRGDVGTRARVIAPVVRP